MDEWIFIQFNFPCQISLFSHAHVSDGAQNEHFVTVCHQEIALAIQLHGFSLFFSAG
jgi:hypothetical protein